MDVYKLYGSIIAAASGVAQLDIKRDGWIVAILGSLTVSGADALNDGFAIELSFASTQGYTSNDTTASFFTLAAIQEFLTSGGGGLAQNLALTGIAIPVKAGERIFLHAIELGSDGPIAQAVVYMYVMEAGGPGRPDIRLR